MYPRNENPNYSFQLKIMAIKTLLKRDYIFILILAVLRFLSSKNVIPNFSYLLIALPLAFYFFPVKLFLDKSLFDETKSKKIVKVLSYFIISSIIVFSALLFYEDERNSFIVNTFLVYSLLNTILFFYFYFTENISYYFILTLCASFLVSIPIMT